MQATHRSKLHRSMSNLTKPTQIISGCARTPWAREQFNKANREISNFCLCQERGWGITNLLALFWGFQGRSPHVELRINKVSQSFSLHVKSNQNPPNKNNKNMSDTIVKITPLKLDSRKPVSITHLSTLNITLTSTQRIEPLSVSN